MPTPIAETNSSPEAEQIRDTERAPASRPGQRRHGDGKAVPTRRSSS